MKIKLLTTIIATILFTTVANADTSFSQVFRLTEPVGTLFTFNVQSNSTSYFRGNFQSTFKFTQNADNPFGKTTFNRSFNFNGNSNYVINNKVNSNNTQWSFNPW